MISPTEKLAALRALEEGLDQALESVKEEVRQLRELTGATGFNTEWGKIEFAKSPAKIKIARGEALLAYAREHYPHEVVEAKERTVTVDAYVRDTLVKTLEARFKVDGGKLVDTDTGEILDPVAFRFLLVEPEKPDVLKFKMPADRKELAGRLVADRVEQITTAIRPELEQ